MTERWEEIRAEVDRWVREAGPMRHDLIVDAACKRAARAEKCTEEALAAASRAQERVRCWTDGDDPPALEDADAIGVPDIRKLVDAAPRFRGDRDGGPVAITLENYQTVASRSEIVAYGRALAWQQRRIADQGERIAELERILREIGILADQIDAEGDHDFAGLPERVASLVGEAWNRGGDRG